MSQDEPPERPTAATTPVEDEVENEAVAPPTLTRLLRSSAVVTVGTGLSRVTGLARTIVLAYALGTTALADAYNLANTAPNVVYDLILGGVLAATLVPVLVPYVDRDDRRAVGAATTVISLALVALTVVAVVFAPAIVRLYTFALPEADRVAQEAVAVPLLRLFLPQVLFYGLTALFNALLNARRSFAAPALAPVLNNVVVICVLLAVPRVAGGTPTLEQVTDDTGLMLLLGAGTTAGIVAMALVLVPFLRIHRVPLSFNLELRHPAVLKILRLSGWTVGYVMANQVSLVVLLSLANASGDGNLSAYSYAYLFFQVPYGLFAVAVMTTFLPELARAASAGDLGVFRRRFAAGLRLIDVVLLPAAILFLVTAEPLVRVLFERGAFGDASVEATSQALVAFAAGLPGFALFLYAMRGFYAFSDTRTPFLLNTAETLLTIALAVPLWSAFGLVGVVAAFSGAYTVGAVVAMVLLARRVGGFAGTGIAAGVGRHLLAGAALGAVAVAAVTLVDVGGSAGPLAEVAVAVVAGGLAYVGVLAATGSDDLRWVTTRLRRRQAPLDELDEPDGGPGTRPGAPDA